MNVVRRPLSHSTLFGVVAVVLLLLAITYFLTGFPFVTNYDRLLDRGVFPDVLHEQATAWEAIWGDPYQPLSEILSKRGYESLDVPAAPRPPSALLVQLPLVLIPSSLLMPGVLVLILLLVIWIGWLVRDISGIEPWKLLLAAPLVLISLPVMSTLSYSPIGVVFTIALTLSSWRYQDRPWAGILLGIAIGLRLWPALVVVGFWLAGRKRLALTSVGTFVVLTIAGLLLPGVDLASSIHSLTSPVEYWMNNNTNASLALVLWPYGVPPAISIVVASALGVLAAFRDRVNALPITLVAGLIATPLSWPPYILLALAVVAIGLRGRPSWLVVAIAVPLALWSLLLAKWLGHAHFFALVGCSLSSSFGLTSFRSQLLKRWWVDLTPSMLETDKAVGREMLAFDCLMCVPLLEFSPLRTDQESRVA